MMVTWDYAAGYFDGEGHAGVYRGGDWRLCWCNTHLPSLEAIQRLIGCGVLVERDRENAGGLGTKTMYELQVRRVRDLKVVIPELLQRCIIKTPDLERLLAHIENKRDLQGMIENARGLDRDAVIRMYVDERKSKLEISQIVGTSTNVVHAVLLEAGVEIRNRRDAMRIAFDGDRWTKDTPLSRVGPDGLRAMYWDEGLTLREIADKIGVHRQSVGAYMKRHNVPLRGRFGHAAA